MRRASRLALRPSDGQACIGHWKRRVLSTSWERQNESARSDQGSGGRQFQQFVAERVGASRLALWRGDGQARPGNTQKKNAPGRLTEGYRGNNRARPQSCYFLPVAFPGLGVWLWILPGGARPPSLPGAKFFALSPGSLECPGVAPCTPLSRCPGAVGERPFCWATAGTLKTIAAMATAVMRIMFRSMLLGLGPRYTDEERAMGKRQAREHRPSQYLCGCFRVERSSAYACLYLSVPCAAIEAADFNSPLAVQMAAGRTNDDARGDGVNIAARLNKTSPSPLASVSPAKRTATCTGNDPYDLSIWENRNLRND